MNYIKVKKILFLFLDVIVLCIAKRICGSLVKGAKGMRPHVLSLKRLDQIANFVLVNSILL